MSKFTFTGGGGGGGDSLPTASGELYLLRDGSRSVSGHLVPSGDNTVGLGNKEGLSFSSGVFGSNVVVGTALLRTSSSELLIRTSNETGYAPVRMSVASGTSSIGSAGKVFASGVPISDYIKTESQITTLAETFVEGGTANPASGVHVGAATQMWISGIPVGDYLSATASVDLSAVAQDIIPDASGTRAIGSNTKPWLKGYFNNIRLFDSNGVQWTLSVNPSGTLSVVQSPGG